MNLAENPEIAPRREFRIGSNKKTAGGDSGRYFGTDLLERWWRGKGVWWDLVGVEQSLNIGLSEAHLLFQPCSERCVLEGPEHLLGQRSIGISLRDQQHVVTIATLDHGQFADLDRKSGIFDLLTVAID